MEFHLTLGQIEKRLLALEKTVQRLKRGRKSPGSRRWWVDDAGRFAGDRVFDEIVRLGREYREAQRPKNGGAKRGHS